MTTVIPGPAIPGPAIPGPVDPPARLLMGPGPISAYPSVLRAMSAPLVGQYDPFMTTAMAETQELYRLSLIHISEPTRPY